MKTLALLLVVAFACFFAHGEDVVADVEDVEVLVPREVTIDAAFRYNSTDIFLISGDEYMAVSPDGFERYIKMRAGDSDVPITENIQAAVNWPRKPTVYFYGNEFSYRVNQTELSSRKKAYAKGREFLQDGGPDAVSFRKGYFYLFKGCEYVHQKATLHHLGTPKNISDLGLPCDIDAAWTDVDRRGMTILKGDYIWHWGDELTGPKPFDSVYHIWSWQLKPTPEDRFLL